MQMNTDNIFGIHLKAVQLRGERAQLLAQNLANADTPGYQARDVKFQDMLKQQGSMDLRISTTRSSHMGHTTDAIAESDIKYRNPLQASLDGNTVDMQTERAEFMRNALMYQTSLQFLNGRIKGLMTAIRGE